MKLSFIFFALSAASPQFYGESPPFGSQITRVVGLSNVTITWDAFYEIGGVRFFDFPREEFSMPAGMHCSKFNSRGRAICTWKPTDEQIQGVHSHCAMVFDSYYR